MGTYRILSVFICVKYLTNEIQSEILIKNKLFNGLLLLIKQIKSSKI